jgi:two-component system, LytTR family, response regulator
MIRALIVDDEPRARSRMRRLLSVHPDVDVVGEAENAADAVRQTLQLRPTVVFLDIHMPGAEGLSVLRAIHDALPDAVRPMVVLTTAYDQHAVEAFALEATDYLLKPIHRDRLADTLRRVRQAAWTAPPAPAPAPPAPRATLAGRRGIREVPVDLDDVAAIVLDDRTAFALTPEGRIRLAEGLVALEPRLPPDRFVRVSRSAVVQLSWVDALVPGESGTYQATLREPIGASIAISRRRARALRELLGL